MTSVGDDNQRCANNDRYWDQDILGHELSHGLHLMAASFTIEGFARNIGETFREITGSGKWNGRYAGRNPNEYFATGAQFYFHATSGFKVDAPDPAGGSFAVKDKTTLQQYDPKLFSLLEDVYPCSPDNFIERCQWKSKGLPALDLTNENSQDIESLCNSGPHGTARCNVPSADRKQCGPPGNSRSDCKKMGCCWSNTECIYPIQDCLDTDVYCPDWAMNGECSRNPGYMYLKCPFSCGRCEGVNTLAAGVLENMCQDKNGNCKGWANSGECTNNPNYMKNNCKLACGFCTVDGDPLP
jgi:hypothetical protein